MEGFPVVNWFVLCKALNSFRNRICGLHYVTHDMVKTLNLIRTTDCVVWEASRAFEEST